MRSFDKDLMEVETLSGVVTSYLSLGSNLGDTYENLRMARDKIAGNDCIELIKASPLYMTRPVGKTDQDWFLNQVLEIETSLSSHELLATCQKIESALGRVRVERWGPRTLDIDILLYSDIVSDDPILTLPHPRMHERAFVLVPLCDIAPEVEFGGKQAKGHLAALPQSERDGVEPYRAS